jgi:FlaA1/EpsC-like NDP-sugar epimerase
VLITGAGGSIGSELARQVYQCDPATMVLLGHGENSIFDIYNELDRRNFERRRGNPDAELPTLRPLIADIRFTERMLAILREVQPDIVFHAAAHKHVPLMEANMAEAVLNNVLGTRTLVEASAAAGVERFVMISTDKAVNPTSIMGATKRVAELLVHDAARRHHRAYAAVRFGNVLGSRGSVIETVTHPEMRRYFITIPEAVQLVLHASVLGHGGEVFVLDMGEPVKIVDLAADLVRLSGLKVGRDIDIVFSGLRPGEKLYEELFTNGEEYRRTEHEQIFIAANASSLVPRNLHQVVDRLCDAAQRSDAAEIVACLRALLPEFNPVGDTIAGVGRQEAPYLPGDEAVPSQTQPEWALSYH